MSVNRITTHQNNSSFLHRKDLTLEKIKELTIQINDLDLASVFELRGDLNRLNYLGKDLSPEFKEAIEVLQTAISHRIPGTFGISFAKL